MDSTVDAAPWTDRIFGPDCDVFVERSVKFVPGRRETARVLYGVERARVPGLRARVLGLAHALGLPDAMRDELDLRFGDAFMIHAGQEGTGPTATRKIYLEFARPPEDLPGLRFLAWKARPGAAPVRSTYIRLPNAGAADLRRALRGGDLPDALGDAMAGVLDLACARVDAADLTLLAVREPGTARTSLDLNVYDAGLSVGDVAPGLGAALAQLGHPPDDPGFPAAARLGHLSAGVSRTGAPFLTVYADARLRRAGT
ncbi:MAG: hypothetical protein KDA50_11630 [Rhodobacteraceae bacterium]|nr:hypothetical protein [Paracoccaceae bacterium]